MFYLYQSNVALTLHVMLISHFIDFLKNHYETFICDM